MKLPEAERQSWRTLWADVAATLARAQQKDTPALKEAPPAEAPRKAGATAAAPPAPPG
jgi:hypothetical protein